jgi:anti-sigma regulatory factor (Ser/Thr protein kinase)
MILNLADGLAKTPSVASATALPDFGRSPRGQWPAPSSVAGGPRLARCVLQGEPVSSKTARDFTRATLADWGLTQMYEDTEMVVSELVTNALRHGLRGLPPHGAVAPMLQLVLLRHERRLVTVVTDPGDQAPALSERGEYSESGRGLRIVAALSGSWGWAPLVTGGKAVWAAFDLPNA